MENATPKVPDMLNARSIDSVTLARLINEVRNADLNATSRAYDRVHNRHNR